MKKTVIGIVGGGNVGVFTSKTSSPSFPKQNCVILPIPSPSSMTNGQKIIIAPRPLLITRL